MNRPECITKEHLEYLDKLRDTGVTNMLGATHYLMKEFSITNEREGRTILRYWMETFGEDDR